MSSTYLRKERVCLVVDGVPVVELAVVPQHLAQRRVGLGHGEHPLRVAALRHQLPAGGGTSSSLLIGARQNYVGHGDRQRGKTCVFFFHMTGHVTVHALLVSHSVLHLFDTSGAIQPWFLTVLAVVVIKGQIVNGTNTWNALI